MALVMSMGVLWLGVLCVGAAPAKKDSRRASASELSCAELQAALSTVLEAELNSNATFAALWEGAQGDCTAELAVLTELQTMQHTYQGNSELVYEVPVDVVPNAADLDAWLNAQEWRHFTSQFGNSDGGDVNIQYVTVREGDGSAGACILVPGNTESAEKMDENLQSLAAKGYSPVYAIAHRGQGRSDRLVDDHFKAHVDSKDHYIGDLRDFIDLAMAELSNSSTDASKPRFLVCHSMGCAISFTYLIEEYEAQRPQVFHAVAAFAPLVKADTSPFPYDVAVAIGEVMLTLGLGESYAPTKECTFDECYGDQNFQTSTTQSLTRWKRFQERCVAHKDELLGVDQHVGLCLGGVTARKGVEFFKLYDKLDIFLGQSGKKLAPPMLIQTAGEPDGSDGLVLNSFTNSFCTTGVQTCTLTNYPSARHNLWVEIDSIRTASINEIHNFFQANRETELVQTSLPADLVGAGGRCYSNLDCISGDCESWAFDWMGGECTDPDAPPSFLSGSFRMDLSLIVAVFAVAVSSATFIS